MPSLAAPLDEFSSGELESMLVKGVAPAAGEVWPSIACSLHNNLLWPLNNSTLVGQIGSNSKVQAWSRSCMLLKL